MLVTVRLEAPLSETAPNCFRIRTERAISKKSWWSAAQWTLLGEVSGNLPISVFRPQARVGFVSAWPFGRNFQFP